MAYQKEDFTMIDLLLHYGANPYHFLDEDATHTNVIFHIIEGYRSACFQSILGKPSNEDFYIDLIELMLSYKVDFHAVSYYCSTSYHNFTFQMVLVCTH